MATAWTTGAWYVGAWAGTVWADASLTPPVDPGAGHKKKKKRELAPSNEPYRVVPYPYPEVAEEAPPEPLEIDVPAVSGVLSPRIALADVLPVIEALKLPSIQATTTLYSDEAYRQRQQQLKEDDELILAFIRMIS